MGFSLLSQKVLAILVGAEGIALVGNLKNVVSFFEQFSVLGTSNGLIKFVSEYKDDNKQLGNLFSTAFVFATIAAILSFIVLFFYSNLLNDFIFGVNYSHAYIFKILALIIPFVGINAILYALFNGLSAYKLYSKLTLATIMSSTVLIIVLTYNYGIQGALLAIISIPIIQFLIYFILFGNYHKPYFKFRKPSFTLVFKNQLLSYSVMTLVVVLGINLTDIAIRNLIENKLNIAEAGYWTAMTSISKTYMQFPAAIFPLYILPIYSKITDAYAFRSEVKRVYQMLLPIIVLGMILVFLFRNLIIQLLYTNEFLVIESFFKWQLMGDLMKFIAIVISYQFLAKKQIGYYIFTELLSVILFYIFSVYFIDLYATEGIVIAHFVRYILYFLVVFFILRKNLISNYKSL